LQTLVFNCFCEKKCSNLLTESQKIEVFNRYNSLKSHSEQYLFLKSLVIPDNNSDKKISNLIIISKQNRKKKR
jgi:hypothetical protein